MFTVIPTINQKEKAITTTTELTTTVEFTPDTEANKRLKVAQMAKQFKLNPGVADASVGTVRFYIGGSINEQLHEVVQVTYNQACLKATSEARFPLFVMRAWFTKDEVFAVEFTINGGKDTRLMVKNYNRLGFIGGEEPLTINGEECDERKVRELLHTNLRYDGDQHGNALKVIADNAKEAERRVQHEAKVQAAYAEREASGCHYRTAWVLEKVQGNLADADDDAWKQHREQLNQAYKALEQAYHAELWAIVKANLGKLRCEATITSGDDPYGFVTIGEVAFHILYKWVGNGYWDAKEVRQAIANEFVRNHLS